MLSAHKLYKFSPAPWVDQAMSSAPEPELAPVTASNWYSDFAFAGILGRELAQPLSDMQSVLQQIQRGDLLGEADVRRLTAGIHCARTLAMQSQQISRLACGRLHQTHEKLKLDHMVMASLRERAQLFRTGAIDVFQRLRPVEVIVDASLLHSLLDAALDWATGLGRKLTVTLDVKNWPEHGLLMFKTSHSIADQTHQPEQDAAGINPSGDTVRWYLVKEISHAMGLTVERISSANETCLLLEFPRTVTRLDGLTAVEVDTGCDSLFSESKPMAGTRLLLISNDARLQGEVQAICKRARLVLDCVSNASHAVRFCELDFPTLVVIDQNMRDHVFNELYRDLRNTDPNFPFIEIAATPNTLEMAGWTSDSMSRLSQDALQTHLVTFVATELSKVM